MSQEIRTIDLFCGAGGSSWGAHSAGARLVAGFDMWETVRDVYKDNFPGADFYCGRLEESTPEQLKNKIGKVDLILASPECTNHSVAKGNKPRCEQSKDTALLVLKFAKVFKPRWMVIENVVSMKNWQRYNELLADIHFLGYKTQTEVLNSADFGVPQARKRMFILCDLEKQPDPLTKPKKKIKPVKEVIEGNGKYKFSPLFTPERAQGTLERAERAISSLGKDKPFIVVYYGSDYAGGWQKVDVPLRTITTIDRFAYVKPTENGHMMRMLQPEELKQAMGWPTKYKFNFGTRRDKVKMIGNAVCPPVMEAIVRNLTK